MIILKTNDERLRGFCNLWNAVLQEDTSYENITLLNGETVNNIVVFLKVPLLNIDNRSLHPQIYRGDETTAMTIPFYFPRDFKSKYDMSMLLDAMTWVITDTLSVYCFINAVRRYWLEENLHQRNEYFLKSVDTGLDLGQTLRNLNDRVLLSEMRLDATLKSIPLPSIDEITTKEEVSHIAHKVRITGYLYIASIEDVMTLTGISSFSFSWPKLEDEVLYTSDQSDIVHIIKNFPNGTKFFSFIKHLSSSAKDLPYFPKGHLKDLNAKQLCSIVKIARIPRDFDKNKSIETTFTQMVIINFYIVMKEHLSQSEFTKIVREEQVPFNTHEKIFQSASEILPHKVTQQLKETLERCSDLKKFDLEEMLPTDVLLQDSNIVDSMNEQEQGELKKKFEKLSKYYQSKKAKDKIEVLSSAITFLMDIFHQDDHLNTIMSHYSHIHFLNILHEVHKIIEQLEEFQENEEETSDILELLLMNISDYQSEKEEVANQAGELDYSQNSDSLLNKAAQEKFDRITGRITDFLNDFENELPSTWDIEDYKEFLNDLVSEDAYIETLRNYMHEIDEIEEEIGKPLIDEEIVHKLIYGLIGYYFNLHHTSEILQTVRNSQVPSIGNASLPLKESFSMTFNHSFNSFTPKSIEFTENEYKRFCSIIKSL
ncbi:hypothetical protein [Salinicoccus sp. YB14-2]|uniref:hypothetical protein n=1 Tax=Salinicoccus sp. YB14-2 TaxID=1572701 RepID=UPI00068D3A82|nr:hypothetical protein [Salinicoccus sp. YB14-2]